MAKLTLGGRKEHSRGGKDHLGRRREERGGRRSDFLTRSQLGGRREEEKRFSMLVASTLQFDLMHMVLRPVNSGYFFRVEEKSAVGSCPQPHTTLKAPTV